MSILKLLIQLNEEDIEVPSRFKAHSWCRDLKVTTTFSDDEEDELSMFPSPNASTIAKASSPEPTIPGSPNGSTSTSLYDGDDEEGFPEDSPTPSIELVYFDIKPESFDPDIPVMPVPEIHYFCFNEEKFMRYGMKDTIMIAMMAATKGDVFMVQLHSGEVRMIDMPNGKDYSVTHGDLRDIRFSDQNNSVVDPDIKVERWCYHYDQWMSYYWEDHELIKDRWSEAGDIFDVELSCGHKVVFNMKARTQTFMDGTWRHLQFVPIDRRPLTYLIVCLRFPGLGKAKLLMKECDSVPYEMDGSAGFPGGIRCGDVDHICEVASYQTGMDLTGFNKSNKPWERPMQIKTSGPAEPGLPERSVYALFTHDNLMDEEHWLTFFGEDSGAYTLHEWVDLESVMEYPEIPWQNGNETSLSMTAKRNINDFLDHMCEMGDPIFAKYKDFRLERVLDE